VFTCYTTIHNRLLTSPELREIGYDRNDFLEGFVGSTLAHASHGASVFVLYSLGLAVFPQSSAPKLSFIAACLLILSPAGLFLSAPYGESTFALFAFLGCLLFVRSFPLVGQKNYYGDLLIIASGVMFGLATTVRSNGLLYGIPLLEEALRVLYSVKDGLNLPVISRLTATGIGGISIALGFLLPQYIAYQELCGESPAVWCTRTMPSVYTYIQEHYW
jgi:phosphatidylinositol glycan class V